MIKTLIPASQTSLSNFTIKSKRNIDPATNELLFIAYRVDLPNFLLFCFNLVQSFTEDNEKTPTNTRILLKRSRKVLHIKKCEM